MLAVVGFWLNPDMFEKFELELLQPLGIHQLQLELCLNVFNVLFNTRQVPVSLSDLPLSVVFCSFYNFLPHFRKWDV